MQIYQCHKNTLKIRNLQNNVNKFPGLKIQFFSAFINFHSMTLKLLCRG